MNINELLNTIPEVRSSSLQIFDYIDNRIKESPSVTDLFLFMRNINYEIPRNYRRGRTRVTSLNFNPYPILKSRGNFI